MIAASCATGTDVGGGRESSRVRTTLNNHDPFILHHHKSVALLAQLRLLACGLFLRFLRRFRTLFSSRQIVLRIFLNFSAPIFARDV